MTVRTLLFTDLVDSTQQVRQLGDELAAQMWAEHDRRARQILVRHRGMEIDRTDGFFLLFEVALDAARYSLAYHDAIAGLGLTARVGVHVGSVTLRENRAEDIARGAKHLEVEGLAKPFAARVMALARGGQTLLSASAREALEPFASEGFEVDSHGHYRLKGVEEPVEIFELGTPSSTFTPPPDTEKSYRVVRSDELWRPLRDVRHNLAPERDAFIGRSTELRALAQRLDFGARLVSIVGPGGTGKTRFVRRYGRSWLGDWPGGVYFCDLSEAASLDGVYFAVAFAVGVPLGKDDPGVQLGHAIAGRGRCLVILDNFEQVLEHAPATVGRWLDRAVEAAFVVTSRERLHLAGEEVFPVEPLALATDAIELFAARAKAQRPDFALNEKNHSAVAEVVRLLDGLPLAIELAAARVRVFSPGQLVRRMRDRFRLLAGAGGAATRQATLKAAIDWSWELLTPWEQAALAQCSVFEGGFTLEAAEAVLDLGAWSNAPPVMNAVQSLVDKSLVRSWVPIEQSRFDIDEPYFGMYLSIHEYAADKLDGSATGATGRAQHLHGDYFATFGTDEAIEALWRHGGVKRRQALALEVDNLVSACRRAVDQGRGDVAVASFRAAWEVLSLRGPFALGAELATRALALPGTSAEIRVVGRIAQAQVAWLNGRMSEAHTRLEDVLLVAQQTGDRRHEANALQILGVLSHEQGQMDRARSMYEMAIDIQVELGGRLQEGWTRRRLGALHSDQGRKEEGRRQYEVSIAIAREVGDLGSEGTALGNLANLVYGLGHIEEAIEMYLRAIEIYREVGDHNTLGLFLGNLGALHQERGELEAASARYLEALGVVREVGNRRYEGMVLGNLGSLRHLQGSHDEALLHFNASLALVREVGQRRAEAFVVSLLGSLCRDLGQFEAADSHYQQALAMHRALDNRYSVGTVLGSLADLLIRQGKLLEASEALREAEDVLREVDDPLELAKTLCLRGQVEVAECRLDDARATQAQAEATALDLNAKPDSELGLLIKRLRELLP